MIGIEFGTGDRARAVAAESLARGVIVLPAGPQGEVLSVTPPLSIDAPALEYALATIIASCAAAPSEASDSLREGAPE